MSRHFSEVNFHDSMISPKLKLGPNLRCQTLSDDWSRKKVHSMVIHKVKQTGGVTCTILLIRNSAFMPLQHHQLENSNGTHTDQQPCQMPENHRFPKLEDSWPVMIQELTTLTSLLEPIWIKLE